MQMCSVQFFKRLCSSIAICLWGAWAHNAFAQDNFKVMFYNVENLFDCRHDTLKNDKEFLPTSMRAWGYGRYKTKIHNIAKVITAVGGWTPPILVGMCEVENSKVMDDLVKYSSFKEHGYRYVMTDSPDERGIDVALLYQRSNFKLLNCRSIRVNFRDKARRPTRDVLHASGLIMNGDTLDVFVCHLPSRAGGESVSEPARLFATSVIKRATDSLFCIRSHPNLIVMGDFNDYPHNASLTKVLQAGAPVGTVCSCKLYNLLADKEANHSIGSYKYQGEWGILDQLIVSGFLLNNSSGLHTSVDKARICNFPFLLERDDKSLGLRPFRTYYGMKYQGGFSDHLPVCVDFELRD